MANQGNQIVLQGDIEERIQPLNISNKLILTVFFISQSIITPLGNKSRLNTFVVKAKGELIPPLWQDHSTNGTNVTPLTAFLTQSSMATGDKNPLHIAAAASQIPSRPTSLYLSFITQLDRIN